MPAARPPAPAPPRDRSDISIASGSGIGARRRPALSRELRAATTFSAPAGAGTAVAIGPLHRPHDGRQIPRFAIATTLVLSTVLVAAPARAIDVPGGVIDRGILDPGVKAPDVACYADVSTAEAKLAKSLVRCVRGEKRSTPATFNARVCQKKALRRRVKAAPLLCTGIGGGETPPKTTARYSCSGLLCQCTGDADCNDMFSNAGCGDVASCDTSGSEPVCSCLVAID